MDTMGIMYQDGFFIRQGDFNTLDEEAQREAHFLFNSFHVDHDKEVVDWRWEAPPDDYEFSNQLYGSYGKLPVPADWAYMFKDFSVNLPDLVMYRLTLADIDPWNPTLTYYKNGSEIEVHSAAKFAITFPSFEEVEALEGAHPGFNVKVTIPD